MKPNIHNKTLTSEDFELLHNELREYLFAQITLLKGACNKVSSKRAAESKILLASSCTTATSIHRLGDNPLYFTLR